MIRVALCDYLSDGIYEVTKKFEREEHVRVNYEIMSWDTLCEKVSDDLVKQEGKYDIISYDYIWSELFSTFLEDLSPYTKEEAFIEPLSRIYGTWKGKKIGIPFASDVMLLYYRKDFFRDYNDEFLSEYKQELKIPRTWKSFLTIAQFFKDAGLDIAIMGKKTHCLFYNYLAFFAPYRRSTNGMKKYGTVIPELGDFFRENGTPAFDNEDGETALEHYKEAVKLGHNSLNSEWFDTIDRYSKGNCPMLLHWALGINYLKKNSKKEIWENTNFCIVPGNAPPLGGFALGINKNSKHKEKSFKLIKFLKNEKNDKILFESGAIGPCRKTTFADKAFTKKYPFLKTIENSIKKCSIRPRITYEPNLEDVMCENIYTFFLDQMNAHEALKTCAENWKKIMAVHPKVS